VTVTARANEPPQPVADRTPPEVAAFRLHGRVQGVGFRWWTRQEALRRGLVGTVRNRPDGSVEVRVRGDPAAIQELRRVLADGPPGARVDTIEPLSVPGEWRMDDFQITG
jgi:acylphosphatase